MTAPSPTNLAYTSFIEAQVHGGSFADGLASVLPCFWIYWETAKRLVERGSPHPVYQRWIESYRSEEFERGVTAVLDLVDRVGTALGPDGRERQRQIVLIASPVRVDVLGRRLAARGVARRARSRAASASVPGAIALDARYVSRASSSCMCKLSSRSARRSSASSATKSGEVIISIARGRGRGTRNVSLMVAGRAVITLIRSER